MALGDVTQERKRGRHASRAARSALQNPARTTVTDITPRFKLVFVAVLAITLLCLMLNMIIVLVAPHNSPAASFADTCSTAFKLGFGAIVGLVGGKVTLVARSRPEVPSGLPRQRADDRCLCGSSGGPDAEAVALWLILAQLAERGWRPMSASA